METVGQNTVYGTVTQGITYVHAVRSEEVLLPATCNANTAAIRAVLQAPFKEGPTIPTHLCKVLRELEIKVLC